MQKALNKLLIYGLVGWAYEIIFTALSEPTIQLKGWTYLWMFPIWSLGIFALEKIYARIKHWNILTRALIYTICIFCVEYVTGGVILLTTGQIPWDYSYAEWNIHGLIRLDYFLVWAWAGMLTEYIVRYINHSTERQT